MKKINIIICLLICIFLTGCFDKVELEERAFVLAMSIDKYNEKIDTDLEKTGEEKRYVVSMAMPEVSESEKTGEKSNEDNPMENENNSIKINNGVKKGEGSSISSTMDLIDTYLSQNLYYGHTKAIILGKEVLENEQMLKEILDTLERNREISRKIIVLVSKTTGKDILEIIPKDEKMIGIYINDFYKNNKKNASYTFRMDLEDVIKNLLSSNGDTAIPTVEIKGDDIRLTGLAILNNYKIVGFLNDRETKGLLWVLDKNSLGTISTNFEETFVSLDLFKKGLEINFEEIDNKILCNINIKLKGNISGYILNNQIFEKPKKFEELEKSYENYLKNEIKYSIESLKNLNSDVLSLKERIRKNNYNLYKKFNINEENIYENLIFNINCKVDIKGYGTIK